MPYADPQAKIERQREWRKKAIALGYGKWLYQKRKRVYQDAEWFREALLAIALKGDAASAQIAEDALADSRERWDSLGPSPSVD